jgi:hypothetical protein
MPTPTPAPATPGPAPAAAVARKAKPPPRDSPKRDLRAFLREEGREGVSIENVMAALTHRGTPQHMMMAMLDAKRKDGTLAQFLGDMEGQRWSVSPSSSVASDDVAQGEAADDDDDLATVQEEHGSEDEDDEYHDSLSRSFGEEGESTAASSSEPSLGPAPASAPAYRYEWTKPPTSGEPHRRVSLDPMVDELCDLNPVARRTLRPHLAPLSADPFAGAQVMACEAAPCVLGARILHKWRGRKIPLVSLTAEMYILRDDTRHSDRSS